MLQDSFSYTVEQFADLQILRYRVPGFENLPLRRKQLIYYLSQAALEGRDILIRSERKIQLADSSSAGSRLYTFQRWPYQWAVSCTGSLSETCMVCKRYSSSLCMRQVRTGIYVWLPGRSCQIAAWRGASARKKVKHVRLCAISCFR